MERLKEPKQEPKEEPKEEPGKGINEDRGAYVKIDLWGPVLCTMD